MRAGGRFDSPAQIIARTAARDLQLHGVRIPAGSRILLLAGSASRDGQAFPSPDRYDLRRDTGKHINFGSGRHFCLGAALGGSRPGSCLNSLCGE
ncbi:MAG: cytochrome P450 [Gemmatimonadota bacterium]